MTKRIASFGGKGAMTFGVSYGQAVKHIQDIECPPDGVTFIIQATYSLEGKSYQNVIADYDEENYTHVEFIGQLLGRRA